MKFCYPQEPEWPELIHTDGCYDEFEELIQRILPTLAGVGLGIVVLEVHTHTHTHARTRARAHAHTHTPYIYDVQHHVIVGEHLSLNWIGHRYQQGEETCQGMEKKSSKTRKAKEDKGLGEHH